MHVSYISTMHVVDRSIRDDLGGYFPTLWILINVLIEHTCTSKYINIVTYISKPDPIILHV